MPCFACPPSISGVIRRLIRFGTSFPSFGPVHFCSPASSTRGPSRCWRAIGAYGLTTAFFNSGTFPAVVPHQVSVLAMVALTVCVYGPIHLIIAYGLEGIIQLINRSRRRADPSGEQVGRSRLRWGTFGFLVLATVSLPFVLRSLHFASIRNRAIARANKDWAAGKASVYSRLPFQTIVEPGIIVESDYDQETGLRLYWSDNIFGFADSYNARIAQLIAKHGVPDWSMARYLVKPADFLRAPGIRPLCRGWQIALRFGRSGPHSLRGREHAGGETAWRR